MNKKKQTFSVLFWLRKGRTTENMSPLYCRVTISGQRYEIPMNIHLSVNSWSATAQRTLGKTAVDKEANRCIERMNDAIEETLSKLKQKGYVLNVENFKLMHQAQENEYSTISALFEYHSILESKKMAKSTNAQYQITLNHLLSYVRIKYHVADYDINAIDKAFVQEFFAYLQGFKRQDDIRPCHVNGAIKHIQRFSKVMNIALENEWISRNPVATLHPKKNKVEKGFLTDQELKAIEAVTLDKPCLITLRDMFFFSVYTGAAYIDMRNFTCDNINIGMDGTPWLNYHRQKTGVRVALPLVKPAQCIWNKYQNMVIKRGKGVFPMICNTDTNKYLKIIARKAGINKVVTYHTARHTFATTITLMRGIPIETVSKMLGHTNLATTQIYAKVVDTKVMDDMAALKKMYAERTETQQKVMNEQYF